MHRRQLFDLNLRAKKIVAKLDRQAVNDYQQSEGPLGQRRKRAGPHVSLQEDSHMLGMHDDDSESQNAAKFGCAILGGFLLPLVTIHSNNLNTPPHHHER